MTETDVGRDLQDLAASTGRHAGHTLEQVGRCVYCSCGDRLQGRLTQPPPARTKDWQVRLADGFIAYVGPEGDARRVADKHEGAVAEKVR